MSSKLYKKSIFIFRRDFRLDDNIGLIKALSQSEVVIPIFIFTPTQIQKNSFKSDRCVQFMVKSLQELDSELKTKGSKLNYFYGEPAKVIKSLISDNDVNAIFVNMDYTPYSKIRDLEIEGIAKKAGCSFNMYEDILLNSANTILNGQGEVFVKFTPYFNKARTTKIDNPIKNTFKNYFTKKVNITFSNTPFKNMYTESKDYIIPGRKAGLLILKTIKKFKNYNSDRNKLDTSTTNLSAYIKFGCISIREAYHSFKTTLGTNNDLIKQLYWRDFYYGIAYRYPQVFDKKGGALKPIYNSIKWENNKSMINKWCEGKTGFPIIDAAMTEMNQTGFMHNRARLIVASFLVKIMLVDWKVGEKYFAQKLVDYDPSVNNGNWQWIAGSGADAQPYFRIFNPWSQGLKHDPNCVYIKKWLPVLANVDNKHIHEWDLYCSNYKISYPKPILDYKERKEKALETYKKIYK